MKPKRYYLAHPLEVRKEVRKEELKTEEETGVELYNPFYDSDRTDIIAIDAGEKKRDAKDLDSDGIVDTDLRGVHSCRGTVAIIRKGTYSIGTICECWETLRSTRHPVYVISPTSLGHPWVRYIIKHSGGMGFSSWDDFRAYLLEK